MTLVLKGAPIPSDWLAARVYPKLLPMPNGCIEWQGTKGAGGYGRVWLVRTAQGINAAFQVHRLIYEVEVGPIPEGLVIDHLCRNPPCANVQHLEPVTIRENTLRGVGPTAQQAQQTHCGKGHEFTPANTHIDRKGKRRCRTCNAQWTRDHYTYPRKANR